MSEKNKIIELDFDKIREDFGSVANFTKFHGYDQNVIYKIQFNKSFVVGSKNEKMFGWLRDNGYVKNISSLPASLRGI